MAREGQALAQEVKFRLGRLAELLIEIALQIEDINDPIFERVSFSESILVQKFLQCLPVGGILRVEAVVVVGTKVIHHVLRHDQVTGSLRMPFAEPSPRALDQHAS